MTLKRMPIHPNRRPGKRGVSSEPKILSPRLLRTAVQNLRRPSDVFDEKISVKDLVELDDIRRTMEKFSLATGFTTALLEHPSQEILFSTGWRDICTNFHRACPESAIHCKKSNMFLAARLKKSGEPCIWPCESGLVEAATPIIIRGKHLASIFSGQVFFEEPDKKHFRYQAAKYGYDSEAYLKALAAVPVVKEDQFRKVMDFLNELAAMVARQGLSNLEIIEKTGQLVAEKERLSVTFASIGDGIIATDMTGKVALMNKVAERLTGWSQKEALGKGLDEVFHIVQENGRASCENLFKKIVQEQSDIAFSNFPILIDRHGREKFIADSGAPIFDQDGATTGVVLVFRDVTQNRKIEEELQKALKMESLELLAGGIAHDFNNILSVILANTSAIKMCQESLNPTGQNLLGQVEKAVIRAKDLTNQLFTFSQEGTPLKKPTPLGGVLRDGATFALRGASSKCEFHFPEDLWGADIDAGQIGQVVQNLVLNAEQSMPGGGQITIRAANRVVAADDRLPLCPGRYVEIIIEDQGIGIPKNILPRIFDPYISARPKGRGLGLFISYSIVQKHSGHITVDSTVGKGSTFRVFLPALELKIRPEEAPKKILPATSGKILILEDEEMISMTLLLFLEKMGFEVEAVSEGAQAVERFRKAKKALKPFDLALLDLTIPGGMGGKETLRELMKIDPSVRAIATTGYTHDPVVLQSGAFGFVGVVTKPYSLEDLLQELTRVLLQSKKEKPESQVLTTDMGE